MKLPKGAVSTVIYLEKRRILVPVIVLFASVLPRYSENGFVVTLPHQSGVFSAVNLIDQPLPKFSIATTDWHVAVTL